MHKRLVYATLLGIMGLVIGIWVWAIMVQKPESPQLSHEQLNSRDMTERIMSWAENFVGKKSGRSCMVTAEFDITAGQKARIPEVLEKTRQEVKDARENTQNLIADIKENHSGK
jgi:hypothetical protein